MKARDTMHEKALRVGVLGTGSMGQNHLRVLSSMFEYDLVGCFDVNQEICAQQAEKFGIKAFETQEELLSEVDVVHIVTPSFLHKECAVAAAKAGCHVLVEKPIALTCEDADVIIDACKAAGTKLCVGHVERYNPAVSTMLSIVSEEEIVSVTFERMSPPVTRIFDASVVEDLMIHDIDVLNALVDSPIKKIAAHGAKIYSDTLDYAQALITFENGIMASITASRATEAKIRTARVSAKKSYISVDYLGRTVDISRKTSFSLDIGYATQYAQENIVEKIMVPMNEPLRVEFLHFSDCIRNDKEPTTSGLMAKKALMMCHQIQELALVD